MAKAQKTITFDDLMKLAKRFSVEDNEMFISCAKQYEMQTNLIDKMKRAIEDDEMLVTKEYVKGRENVMANPLIKELPKHYDSANKTLGIMLNIIEAMGSREEKKQSKLNELMNE